MDIINNIQINDQFYQSNETNDLDDDNVYQSHVIVDMNQYSIESLKRYSSFFRELVIDESNTNNLNGGKLVEINDNGCFKISYCSLNEKRDCAIKYLFNVITTDDDKLVIFDNSDYCSVRTFGSFTKEDRFTNYGILIEMHELLDEFGIDDVVKERFHKWFPYFSSLSYEKAPHGNANRCYYHNTYSKNGKLIEERLSGWEVLKKQLNKEGERCQTCFQYNPWIAPLNTDEDSICSCLYYRNDMYERQSSNPYFDEDNWRQREADMEDENRRWCD